ncbi:hypothetical protein [Ruegeria sp. HKCCE3926]|uniref:hypothetical protein n=1 Tax=Ruegeria sp. HKCCE3926 TaxID=2794831 RepID=UPI001AE79404|nr:hypothetical protein [Ruegeria sp. HKCCE3926]
MLPETALLTEPGIAIVLAEPGAGKTDLLDSVANRLGGARVRASVVRPSARDTTLIVDAFDEVARVGDARVHDILHRIRDSNPDRVLLSSRSGEWEDSRTRLISDLFGKELQVAYLVPLDGCEQRRLFEHLHPRRSFDEFHADIHRFELHHILGNPEFLRLFASAHDEADGRLTSRGDVFTLAIENLARESNPDVLSKGAPTRREKIIWANEIFSKLLLSGVDGVALGDIAEDDLHPQMESIGLTGEEPLSVLGTRLFRPGTAANHHEPVHRIVAEYGAAQYIVSRINDPTCRLTVSQCLALIAPNGVVRDDLRGLTGWMAALGSESLQNAAIELDPYAVLSNGDPSRLTSASRNRLLDALARLNEDDPYFRRSDRWRSFSVTGFFTPDVIQAVRPILADPGVGHLRQLLLELLVGSPAVRELRPDLEAILLEEQANVGPRMDALSCLLSDETYEPAGALQQLVDMGTNNALRLASEFLMHMMDAAPYDGLLRFLEAATELYPTDRTDRSRVIEERYFLKRLIRKIPNDQTVRLLDGLTEGLHCTCREDRHRCHCRDGISKIVGLLLDNYFERVSGPHDPDRVWEWVRNLHFHGVLGSELSRSIAVLQSDDTLRRALQERAFAGLVTREEIQNAFYETFMNHGHSGLHLCNGDARHLIDHAYQTDNSALWIQLAPAHDYFGNRQLKGPDELRKHCREQAGKKPALMREWTRMNRLRRAGWEEGRIRRSRFDARRRRQKLRVTEANTAYFHAHRSAVERGEIVGWTQRVARAYLIQPDLLPDVTHGLFDPEVVLRRSLQALGDRCPSIEEVSEGQKREWVQIFLAGAVAEFRATRTLAEVKPEILRVIFTDTGGYNTFAEGEEDEFLAEIRRWVLLTADEAATFAREYLEPSLAVSTGRSNLHLLNREPALNDLRASLPLEWLHRFPELPVQTLETLFDMAARFGDRDALISLVRERCISLDEGMLPHRWEEQRPFWFPRDFWVATEINPSVWAYMARNPDFIFWLADRRDRGGQGDEIWARLSAPKVERILMAYLPHWPVVPLPSSWGTGSPRGETAYRYLRDLVWQIGRDEPNVALPVVERLLAEEITAPSHNDLRSIRADLRRKAALTPRRPGPAEIAASLDGGPPASVEQLRALMLELLEELQKDIRAGDSGVIDQFFNGANRLDEVGAMFRVSAWLKPRLHSFDIHDVVEHQLGARNRCDLTATRMVRGQARMLVIEGKGQWHRDLMSAAASQLADRYSMHQHADEQGIYLVIWYGAECPVAGLERHEYASASELQAAICEHLPNELRGRIDVFVLDVSRAGAVST